MTAEAMFARRYGMRGPGGGRFDPRAMMPRPAPVQPVAPAPAPASKGGLPIALDEKQLKITLMLFAVKPVIPK